MYSKAICFPQYKYQIQSIHKLLAKIDYWSTENIKDIT